MGTRPQSVFRRDRVSQDRCSRQVVTRGTRSVTSSFWTARRPALYFSMLTFRTPGRRAPADCGVLQRCAVTRTNPVSLPSLMDEPVPRRIGVIATQSLERSFRDELGLAQQRGALTLAQFSGGPRWMNLCPPQNLVRHPIADSGKTVLHEQNRFDRRFTMSIQELVEKRPIELRRNDFGNIA